MCDSLCLPSQTWTMSHPSWLPPKSTNEPLGHVTARMETTHTFGTPSISVSTQQTPKKFAPVVAPKPKYNPYKQPGGDGEYLFFRKEPQLPNSEELTANTGCSWFALSWWVCGSLPFSGHSNQEESEDISSPWASCPPERCRAGRGHKDRSFLILIENRCPMSKTGTFQEVFLV